MSVDRKQNGDHLIKGSFLGLKLILLVLERGKQIDQKLDTIETGYRQTIQRISMKFSGFVVYSIILLVNERIQFLIKIIFSFLQV